MEVRLSADALYDEVIGQPGVVIRVVLHVRLDLRNLECPAAKKKNKEARLHDRSRPHSNDTANICRRCYIHSQRVQTIWHTAIAELHNRRHNFAVFTFTVERTAIAGKHKTTPAQYKISHSLFFLTFFVTKANTTQSADMTFHASRIYIQ